MPSHELIGIAEGEDVSFQYSEDSGSLVSAHWHNSLEIIYLLSGELNVTVNGECSDFSQDDVILINSRDVHSTKCTEGNTAVLLQIPYHFLKRYIPEISELRFKLSADNDDPVSLTKLSQFKDTMRQLYIINGYHPVGDRLKFTSLIFELLYQLRHSFCTEIPTEEYAQRSKVLQRLEPVIKYTADNYSKQISIKEIASVAAFQPEYFCRFFKKNTGLTYLEYLSEIRLSHIYNDITSGDMPLNYLLDLHGFTNYKLFRKMFSEKFGTTPGKLRKEIKAQRL